MRQGHEVTLFASGDSITTARLVAAIEESTRTDARLQSWLAFHSIQMDQVAALAAEFDVIHFHTDYLHFPIAKTFHTPHLTTLHGRQDLPELAPLYRHFGDIPLISISKSQRTPLPWVNWRSTVYHGLPVDMYRLQPEPGNYFAFVGRVSREKRLDRAIDIAIQCDTPLYIAAKIDAADEPYFNQVIKPRLDHPLMHYIGEVSEPEKRRLLENARALLFPIDWPEPFGLVLIEAFAVGTPVIAYRHGAIPEVMEDGVTGYVVTNQDEAVRAAKMIACIDRRACRQVFERRFTVARMAEGYLRTFRDALSGAMPVVQPAPRELTAISPQLTGE
ncbi:MAG: glycosyltransferase family 4 protein [Herminiimonas sp.]|nr:glycosyltransferase family 4 protein [Herminiimonas sp.]